MSTISVRIKKTWLCVAVVFLTGVGAAAPVGAEASSVESTGTVTSPYTFFDSVGDGGGYADITAVRVRNESVRVVLRYWARNWDRNVYLGTRYYIDLRVNGPGVDYTVALDEAPGVRLEVINARSGQTTCASSNVSEGSDVWGHSVLARFPSQCLGGRFTFRTLLHFGSFFGPGDWAPNPAFGQPRYTPWIRPSS